MATGSPRARSITATTCAWPGPCSSAGRCSRRSRASPLACAGWPRPPGKPGLYHETITWAYVLLVNERRAPAGEEDWPAFAARNPDLLAWRPSLLETKYYREETLWSERARRVVRPARPNGLTA